MVFLMNMERRLLWTQTSELMLHPKLGVAMPYINRKLNICRRTLMQEAFDEQRRLDELAERARLLYVAMTRAKLHLELVATVADLERTKWDLDLPPSDSRVREAGSMITWVMQAISTDAHTKSTNYPQASTPWDCRDWDELPQKTVDKVRGDGGGCIKGAFAFANGTARGRFPGKNGADGHSAAENVGIRTGEKNRQTHCRFRMWRRKLRRSTRWMRTARRCCCRNCRAVRPSWRRSG